MTLRTEQEYVDALARIDSLMGAEANTPEAEELDELATAVEAYEREHYSEDEDGLTERDKRGIAAGLADVEAGRVRNLEDIRRDLKARKETAQ